MTNIEKSSFLIFLTKIQKQDLHRVGNKAWFLSLLVLKGFDVPRAIILTPEACEYIVLKEKDPVIHHYIMKQIELMLSRYLSLSSGIAVRSSSIHEDNTDRSLAGQFSTFLRLNTLTEIHEAIVNCYESYIEVKNKTTQMETTIPAVLLQDFIEADWAGVAFSRNPLNTQLKQITIEFCKGTAEALVNASITPFRAWIDSEEKLHLSIETQRSNDLELILKNLSEIVRAIEHHFGYPVDVEWAAKDRQIWILQARPITVMSQFANDCSAAVKGVWTRGITEDLWADKMTPMESSLLIYLSPCYDMRVWAKYIGIDIPKDMQTVNVIDSHLYVNCEAIELVLSRLPKCLQFSEIMNLIPQNRRTKINMKALNLKHFFYAAVKAISLTSTTSQASPILYSWSSRRALLNVNKEIELLCNTISVKATPNQLIKLFNRWICVLGKVLEMNQFPYFYTFFYSWALEATARKLGVVRDQWLQLYGGTRNNSTQQMLRDFKDIGKKLQDIDLDDFSNNSCRADLLNSIHLKCGHQVARSAEDIILKYGARSGRRSLTEKRWADQPLDLLKHAQWASRIENPHINKQSPHLFLNLMLRLANHSLDLREDLRFCLDRVLYGLQKFLFEIGNQYNFAENILYLKYDELLNLLKNRYNIDKVYTTIDTRKSEFLSVGSPPRYWIDGFPYSENHQKDSPNFLYGTAASPGIASGPVRTVRELNDSEKIQFGDIVVAELLGPAWASILGVAAAFVTEKGGMLDHFAILAREAGIPLVTSAPAALEVLGSKPTIRVNGGTGVITW